MRLVVIHHLPACLPALLQPFSSWLRWRSCRVIHLGARGHLLNCFRSATCVRVTAPWGLLESSHVAT